MTSTWLLIFLALMGGNLLIAWLPYSLLLPGIVLINLGVLGVSYFIFRRDPFVDLRANMLFMLGLTVINILTDLGLMSYTMSWVAFGALLIWSWSGGGRSR